MSMKISIITISYNNLEGLKRTVSSVLGQSFSDIEYIVIDGGAEDDSDKFLAANAEQITYWVSEPDKGIYNAMNKGIAQSNGEYLLFLNSGDVFINADVLETMVLQLNGEDIVYGNGRLITNEGKFVGMKVPETLDLPYFIHSSLVHPATFIKKELFNTLGSYNEGNKIVSDWEFFIKAILINNCTTKKVDVMMAEIEDGGISRDESYLKLLAKEKESVLNKYFDSKELKEARQSEEKNKKTFKKASWIRRKLRVLKNKISNND